MAAESGLADAVRPINNLATAQARKVFPSLIDVKGAVRPKEFHWTWGRNSNNGRRRRRHSLAAVVKECEMMLEWAAKQADGNHDDGD